MDVARRVPWFGVLALIVALVPAVAIGACAQSTAPGATPEPEQGVERCPAGTDALRSLVDQEHGYCLLAPTEYEAVQPSERETVLAVAGLLDVENPKAYISVEPADGRTAAEAADDVASSVPGFASDAVEINLGGEPAVLIDEVPGQDLSRQVFVVRGDRLFRLTFLPIGADYGELAGRTGDLYNAVAETFTFFEPEE